MHLYMNKYAHIYIYMHRQAHIYIHFSLQPDVERDNFTL